MSKLEQYLLIFFSFWIFIIVYIRVGYLFGTPINEATFILSIILYSASVTYVYSSTLFSKQRLSRFIPLLLFLITCFILSGLSLLLAYTYDTSWDGQGYHQSAVIALANGWNPVREPEITFIQNLPSQIFAESYPSAHWEIEASIYALTNRINAAKVINVAIAIIAIGIAYSLFRKLNLGRIISVIISLLIVLQPVYIMQLFTFMADGFSYQLLLIATGSLILFMISSRSHWAIATFIMAEIFLVSTKYSNLPIALALGGIFILIIVNRLMNREYRLTKRVNILIVTTLIITLIFSYLPYIRNTLFHGATFYPTNIPELIGSVKYNNIPNNLRNENKLSLLFYGIFSEAQTIESGDPRNRENIARLKIPFFFTIEELHNSAGIYNNRVGSGGPLFSGIVLLSICFVLLMYFKADKQKERYAVYISIFSLSCAAVLSLTAPTPNLLRYVSQLQLIPFLLVVPLIVGFNKTYVKIFGFVIFFLIGLNLILYSGFVFYKNINDFKEINSQFRIMRESHKIYSVKAQQFYSSYILLGEQSVPFAIVHTLNCPEVHYLYASSTTTQYCEYK